LALCNTRRLLQIPSDKVVFNEKPEMKAREITDAAKEALLSGKFNMVRVNFANPDMVGHTGDLKASIYVRSIAVLPACSHACTLQLATVQAHISSCTAHKVA
jgi:bisphosphoglycerate-independent phosphoglycerate mutase (AlkP superfamily)